MKTLSFARDRLVQILSAVFSMAILIGVSGVVSAQTVTVSKTQITSYCSGPQPGPGGQYYVCVDKDPIYTSGQPGVPVSVTWTAGTQGWWFTANPPGIVIDSNQGKPGSNGNQKWNITIASALSYTATNTKENGNRKYRYTINVAYVNGNDVYVLTYDPTIQN